MKKSPIEKDPRFGAVNRECREGERMFVSMHGVVLGFVEVSHVPHDAKVRLCFCFDRVVKLQRGEQP